MIKSIYFLILFGVFFNFGYSLRVGLDSGHSIKELYKSGAAFDVQVIENNRLITLPYYSVAWPAGGVRLHKSGSLSGSFSMKKRGVFYVQTLRACVTHRLYAR